MTKKAVMHLQGRRKLDLHVKYPSKVSIFREKWNFCKNHNSCGEDVTHRSFLFPKVPVAANGQSALQCRDRAAIDYLEFISIIS